MGRGYRMGHGCFRRRMDPFDDIVQILQNGLFQRGKRWFGKQRNFLKRIIHVQTIDIDLSLK